MPLFTVSPMSKSFEIAAQFAPAGDQPDAIRTLVEGLQNGLAGQTLLGVTGSGKTYTIANVIQQVQRPALILAPNKTLAAQLYGEMREFFPNNAVEYFVSYYDYYQPEAYVPSSDTYIEKDASINEHIEQMRLSATKALMERRDVIIVAAVSCIYGLGDPESSHSMVLEAVLRIKADLAERLPQLREANKLVEAQRLEERTRLDIEMLVELGHCPGIENYSRHLAGRAAGEAPAALQDYMPPDALMIIEESNVSISQVGAMYKGDRSRKQNLVDYGFRLPSAMDNRPLIFEEVEARRAQSFFVSATPADYERAHSDQIAEQVVRPTGMVDPQIIVRPAVTQEDDLLSEVNKRVQVGERVLVTTLTKRMAEDLTDYLSEHGVRVRYLHSDIDTVERVEIIRDLRLGGFDVLVGINLLREGLDIPEVSLVAILDADKEGFLRSERSLIQTIGRAARNLNGTAILYADRVTGSMQRASEETERRRNKQLAYNQAHGITPRGIKKAITDIMEGAHPGAPDIARHYAKVAEETLEYAALTPDKLAQRIKKLEQQMYQHARDLEFEQAARVRDELQRLREHALKQTA